MSYFAESIKTLRLQSGLTMQALADKAHVSKSMICKIEKDEVQPTLDVAGRLAHALGKTLSELLHAPQTTAVVFLAKNEQSVWEDANHIKRRNISPVFEGLEVEWLQVELPGGVLIQKNMALHTKGTGDKFVLVTQGILEIKVNQDSYHLKKGDSLYFNASAPHEFFNPEKDPCEYYLVIKHN